jgi:hypothetical protein
MTSLRRAFFAILLAVTIIAGAIGAFRWARLRRIESQKPSTSAPANTTEFRSLPPFSTKEPERYQATRIISSVENKDEPATMISKTLIARDGDKRREEYGPGTTGAVVYLEIPEGRFILSPAKKLYADLGDASGNLDAFKSESNADDSVIGAPVSPDFSPERLLNETPRLARYEKLGSETINERAVTRYRVTARDASNGSNAGGVTMIWIDDALGLPIRSETSSTTAEHPAKLTVELRDLKDTVDPRIFELPKDYEKVDYRRFFSEMPPTPGVPGGERPAPEKP